jgi:hypothetical protein
MMATIEARRVVMLVLLAVALAMTLGVTGCASGPLGSHGVDYIPAFDSPPPDA